MSVWIPSCCTRARAPSAALGAHPWQWKMLETLWLCMATHILLWRLDSCIQCQTNTLVPLTMHDMILWACIVYVSDIWWVHRRMGGIRILHNLDSRFGWVCNQSKGNLPSSKTTSVPTNEVRNNFHAPKTQSALNIQYTPRLEWTRNVNVRCICGSDHIWFYIQITVWDSTAALARLSLPSFFRS